MHGGWGCCGVRGGVDVRGGGGGLYNCLIVVQTSTIFLSAKIIVRIQKMPFEDINRRTIEIPLVRSGFDGMPLQ